MLIVIEGLDGSGKSTQVKRLEKYLEEVSSELEYIHFPRYDSAVYGELIGKFLRGGFGSIDSVHPQLVALLYAEDNRGFLKFNFHGRNARGIFLGWYEDALLNGTERYEIPYDYVIVPFASADYHDFARVYGDWARRQPY